MSTSWIASRRAARMPAYASMTAAFAMFSGGGMAHRRSEPTGETDSVVQGVRGLTGARVRGAAREGER
jgi:hypothetical protein